MSRRAQNNGIRGPSSALTSFLREQGIDARPMHMYQRRARVQDDQNAAAPAAAASTSGANENEVANDEAEAEAEEQSSEAGPSTATPGASSSRAPASSAKKNKKRKKGDESDFDSEDLDEPEEAEAESTTTAKKRKISATAMAKAKAKAKAEHGEGTDDEDDASFNAPSKSKGTFGIEAKATGAKPPVGNFETCASCKKKFTVTRYTMAASPPPGWLCHECAKSSGLDPFKKPKAPARKGKAPEKRKIVSFDEKERIPSLAELCISIITKHIDDVEALGHIGDKNLDLIAKILARNRKLNAHNANLFYDDDNVKLALYDCTALLPDDFCALASFNPALESLRLDYCGRMNGNVLAHWTTHLTSLTSLDLLGPFNVRKEAWLAFFSSAPVALKRFGITQSPRFDLECLEALKNSSDSLTSLKLNEVGQLADEWLGVIGQFEALEHLELAMPSISLTDEAVINLLERIGKCLKVLVLNGHVDLTDEVLLGGVKKYAQRLTTLKANNLGLLTDEGVAKFFLWTEEDQEQGPEKDPRLPLEIIDLSRAPNVSSEALDALLIQSGSELRELNINGWKGVENETLMLLGQKAPKLAKLNVGFCRAFDDFVVKALLDGCVELKEVFCFGCNRLTVDCPRKRGVALRGIELGM